MVKKIRIFMNQKLKKSFFEKREEEVSFESPKNLLDAISFHLADPVTVLLGRTELALDQINNGGMKQKEMEEFIKLCKEELKDIRMNASHMLCIRCLEKYFRDRKQKSSNEIRIIRWNK